MGLDKNIKKSQIKDSVLTIIFRDGIHKLSLKNIANETNMSEGNIYRYYPSKFAIIRDIVYDIKKEFIKNLRGIADKDELPQKKLENYLCYTLKYLHSKKGLTLVLFTEALYKNDIELKKMLDIIYKNQKDYFVNIVLDGIILGQWQDAFDIDMLAYLYMGIPVTINIDSILKQKDFNYKDNCNQIKQCFFKILLKKQ